MSEAVPAGRWRTLTVLAALTLDGMLASMTIESPTNGDVFLAFLEQALGPKLQPAASSSSTISARTRWRECVEPAILESA